MTVAQSIATIKLSDDAILIKDCVDPETAFILLREKYQARDNSVANAYFTAGGTLGRYFTKDEYLPVVNMFAEFDVTDDDRRTRRHAQIAMDRYERWVNKDGFLANLEQHGIAAYSTDDLLYVMHAGVKPGSKKWQCTTFGLGEGPLGDSQLDVPLQALERSALGLIPYHAKLVEPGALDGLLTTQFMPWPQAKKDKYHLAESLSDLSKEYQSSLTPHQFAQKCLPLWKRFRVEAPADNEALHTHCQRGRFDAVAKPLIEIREAHPESLAWVPVSEQDNGTPLLSDVPVQGRRP
jgi:hypothetical protein